MNNDKANRVYDLLVSIGGAKEEDRENFLFEVCDRKSVEYKFNGKLGSGGKYKATWNGVTYYHETKTPEIVQIAELLNYELKKI